MTNPSNTIAPTSLSERIVALDVLRGFAILGILIINIWSFSMIEAAYLNPDAYGDLTGINKWVWITSHILADQKFMTIFSIIFGVGIVLFTSRAEAKGRRSAGLYYRRTIGLLVIGLAHAYLLWHGDILVAYAVCALIAFLFRKISPKWLLILGLVSISIASVISISSGWSMQFWPQEAYDGLMEGWKPDADIVGKEVAAYQSGWVKQLEYRIPAAIKFQTFIFLIWAGWRAGGLMLIGMALFKLGVLTAQRSKKFYLLMMAVGFGIGYPVVALGVARNFAANWTLDYSMFFGSQFNYWGSLFVSAGYVGAIMFICKTVISNAFIKRFAAIGRTTLSNYLLQTIICTLIFYGHGLGLFGKVERSGQILIVFAVRIVQLMVTPIWLRYFRFGPVEWLWRSFTYLKFQPMRLKEEG